VNDRARTAIERLGDRADALLVTKPENRRYLSGFSGSAGTLVVRDEEAVLLTDARYVDQARIEAPGWRIVRHKPRSLEELRGVVEEAGIERLAFEADHVTVAEFDDLCSTLEGVSLVRAPGVVDSIRAVKEDEEIDRLRRASAIADRVFERLRGHLRPGISERDVSAWIEHEMRVEGADAPAFDVIVTSGPRSALPHGRPSGRTIQEGELVLVDMGCRCSGYNSDMTRTLVVGTPDARQRELWEAVLEAQEAALRAIRPGAKGVEVDAVARERLAARGLGELFGHSLGHGVGLAVHEGPYLSEDSEDVLAVGMVVTVEPGVYVTGWGGIRIEDVVVVTEDGCEVLTNSPKGLETTSA